MLNTKTTVRQELVWLYVSQAGTYIVPLALTIYVAKVLAPEGWGQAIYLTALSQYIALAIDFAFHLSGQRMLASCASGDTAAIDDALTRIHSAKLILIGLALPVAVLVLGPAMGLGIADIAFVTIFGVLQGMAFLWFFRGLGHSVLYSKIELVSKIASAICIIAFVREPDHILRFYALTVLGAAISVGVSIYFIVARFGCRIHWDARAGAMLIRDNFNLFLMHFVGTASSIAPLTVIGYLGGYQTAALYGVADKILRPVIGLIEPIRSVMFPRVIRVLAEKGLASAEYLAVLGRSSAAMVGSGLFLSVVLAAVARPLVVLLFGPDYEQAVPVLRIVALLPVLVALNNAFNVLVLIPNHRERQVFYCVACGLIVLIGACFALGSSLEARSMAVVAVASEATVIVLAGVFALTLVWRERRMVST